MTRTSYMRDARKFWQARDEARSTLDHKRVTVSYPEKVKVAEKLRSDADFLKSGRIISSKHKAS